MAVNTILIVSYLQLEGYRFSKSSFVEIYPPDECRTFFEIKPQSISIKAGEIPAKARVKWKR